MKDFFENIIYKTQHESWNNPEKIYNVIFNVTKDRKRCSGLQSEKETFTLLHSLYGQNKQPTRLQNVYRLQHQNHKKYTKLLLKK
jgi:hypothetical protein